MATRSAHRPSTTMRSRRFRVDPVLAHEIAAAFSAQRSTPADPRVVLAYAQLETQADRLFAGLTDPSDRHHVRVVYTAVPDVYRDATELRASVRSHRLLEVFSAAHDRSRRHPLLDCSVGGAFDRFRAVHDIVSHGRLGHDFDRDGEYSAWRAEHRLYHGGARAALATELHAQHSVRWTTGDLAPYRATLLDARLVAASMRAGRLVTHDACARVTRPGDVRSSVARMPHRAGSAIEEDRHGDRCTR